MCFSFWDIIFFVTPGFQESKAVSVGQISKKFELKNLCVGCWFLHQTNLAWLSIDRPVPRFERHTGG